MSKLPLDRPLTEIDPLKARTPGGLLEELERLALLLDPAGKGSLRSLLIRNPWEMLNQDSHLGLGHYRLKVDAAHPDRLIGERTDNRMGPQEIWVSNRSIYDGCFRQILNPIEVPPMHREPPELGVIHPDYAKFRGRHESWWQAPSELIYYGGECWPKGTRLQLVGWKSAPGFGRTPTVYVVYEPIALFPDGTYRLMPKCMDAPQG